MSSLATQFLIDQAGSLLVRFSLDVCLKGSLFLLICFGLYHLFRRSSSAFRHLLISLVFVGLLLLPLGQAIGPEWHLPLLRVPAALNRAGWTLAAAAPQPYWMMGAFILWIMGFGFVMARLLVGLWVTRRLIQESFGLDDEGWQSLIDEVRGSLGLRRQVAVLTSPRLGAAICAGVIRPVVLLPLQADDWSEEQRRVILQHEFSHIRRRDNLTNVLALLVCAVYWFNPLVWWAAARLRVCREGACDDLVLTSGIRPSKYVSFLLETASSRHSTLIAVALSQVSALKVRLLTILDPEVDRRTLRMTQIAPILALGSVALVTIVGVQPWVVPAFRAGLSDYLAFGPMAKDRIESGDIRVSAALPSRGVRRLTGEVQNFRHLLDQDSPGTSGNRYSGANVLSIGDSSALTTTLRSRGASDRSAFTPDGSETGIRVSSPRPVRWSGLHYGQRTNRPTEGSDEAPQPPASELTSEMSISRVDVGTLGGGTSVAADINEIGQVVGRSTTFSGAVKPFLWTKEAGIVGLPCPSTDCRAIDVNNQGQVLMIAGEESEQGARSYLWSPETGILDLGSLGGAFTHAIGVNDRGEVVGSSETTFGTRSAFFWSASTGMLNLGGQQAIAINESGQVVGWASSYAFFWDSRDGVFSRIGPLEVSATPLDLNNQGDVVGFAYYNKGTVPKAFFWSLEHGMVLLDLPDEGGGSSAFRINDSGEVLGVTSASGDEVVYLWTLEEGTREVMVPSALLPRPAWDDMISARSAVSLIGNNLSSFLVAEDLAKLDFGQSESSSPAQGQPVRMNGRGQIAGNILLTGADLVQAVIWEIRLPSVEKAISDLTLEIAAVENLEPAVSAKMRDGLQDSLANLKQNDFRAAVYSLSDFLETLAASTSQVGTEQRTRWVDVVWTSLDRVSQFTALK